MLQILVTILLSSVKFAVTFPLVIMQFQFSFIETILWTNVGGMLGICFFAFLSDMVISWWNRNFKKPRSDTPKNGSSGKKVFTKRNRRIVRIKQQYGLIGIAVATPCLLSIPVGAFLVVRYYRSTKTGFIYLIASNLVWSVIYTWFYLFWDGLLFNRV
ncbi:MAG: hypothetical protein ABFS38_05240 [Bacteroidota bacterium]